MSFKINDYTKSREMFERAEKVIPSGVYGHLGPAEGCFIPVSAFPLFGDRAQGSYFWDVDGNKFIDYMCAYGPNVLGYNDPDVDAAALQQALEYVAWEGRICLLGCTRVPEFPTDFYRLVHRRGVQLLGAHTFSRAKLESAPYHWPQEDDYKAFLKLLANGKMQASSIISEMISPEDAHSVYQMLATDKNPPMGLVFDWTKLA